MDPAVLAAGISAGSNLIGSGVSANMNSRNRRFNANQAQLNRDFQAQQAELARDWQERFYQQYQTPAALVRQGKEAGLHPYAALGMSPQGASSTSVPQGSQASTGQILDPQHSISGIANSMLSLLQLKSTIDVNEAQAQKFRAEALREQTGNKYAGQIFEQQLARGKIDIDIAKKQLPLLDQQINTLKSQELNNYGSWRNYLSSIHLNSAMVQKVLKETEQIGFQNMKTLLESAHEVFKIELTKANTNEVNARTFEQQWLNEYLKKHNINPRFAQSLYSVLMQGMIASMDEDSRSFSYNIGDLIKIGDSGFSTWFRYQWKQQNERVKSFYDRYK